MESRKFVTFFYCLVAATLVGCASTGLPPDGKVPYQVSIETSEPGAKIEVDGDYVGVSPITVTVMGDRDGTFHSFGRPDWTIKAYPLHDGQYVQTKTYHTGAWFQPDDKIPKKIYLGLGLVPEKPGININIKKEQ